MNDIIADIESDILIFADDTSLMSSGTDPAETTTKLNRDLLKISHGLISGGSHLMLKSQRTSFFPTNA